MNIVFWGRERQCKITAHMLTVISAFEVLCPDIPIVKGRFLREKESGIAFYSCTGRLDMLKRKRLWRADLVVVNLSRDYESIEAFFLEDFHVAREFLFLLEGDVWDMKEVKKYLKQQYCVETERCVFILSNNWYMQALRTDRCRGFIERELCQPSCLANEVFIQELRRIVIFLTNKEAELEKTRESISSRIYEAGRLRSR